MFATWLEVCFFFLFQYVLFLFFQMMTYIYILYQKANVFDILNGFKNFANAQTVFLAPWSLDLIPSQKFSQWWLRSSFWSYLDLKIFQVYWTCKFLLPLEILWALQYFLLIQCTYSKAKNLKFGMLIALNIWKLLVQLVC